jgi:hypothetical protein
MNTIRKRVCGTTEPLYAPPGIGWSYCWMDSDSLSVKFYLSSGSTSPSDWDGPIVTKEWIPPSDLGFHTGGGDFLAGSTYTELDTIETKNLLSDSNSSDFGDLTTAQMFSAGSNSETHGFHIGDGYVATSATDIIEVFDFSAKGNATDYGDMTSTAASLAACFDPDKSKTVLAGGRNASNAQIDIIQQFQHSSSADATDFGDLVNAKDYCNGVNGSTWAHFCAGYESTTAVNVIEYVAYDTTGDATDFGDLAQAIGWRAGMESDTYGYNAAGTAPFDRNNIDYFTLDATGNGSNFGNLTAGIRGAAGVSNDTKGIIFGGFVHNKIDFGTSGSGVSWGTPNTEKIYGGACAN